MLSVIFAALTAVASFGPNPGALVMHKYVPAGLPANRPVVVVLHGCTQMASAMESAGWNKLADQYQFAVVYPEQSTANNPVRCFNWAGEYGDPANLTRGQGENASIISMIDYMHTTHGTDNAKVFITGFSAGGAFVPVMLATYPERFAAGSVMAGIAYKCATSVNGAFSCQSPGQNKTAQEWGDLLRTGYSSFTGTRPRVQIWQGSSDTTVAPANATELVEQFTNAAGTDATADETEMIGTAATRTAYKVGADIVVESYVVQSMGHAVAVGAEGSTTCPGTTAAYFEGRPICSTLRAAKFFGLVPAGGGGGGGGGADPTVAIVSPADNDSVSGSITIVVAAGDDTGVASVELEIDGASVGSDPDAPYQFTWDATAAGTGIHELVATATDADGNTATSTISVTVTTGGGGNGNSDTDGDGEPDGPGGLPACSLDAGHHGGATTSWLLIGLAMWIARRRRR